MIDRFEELLYELSKEIATPLHPNRIRACTLTIEDGPPVQLECDRIPGRLLIASFLCESPLENFEKIFSETPLKQITPSQKRQSSLIASSITSLRCFLPIRWRS